MPSPFDSSDFRRYLIGNTCLNLGQTMLGTAIGWELYDRTHAAMALGYVGLVEIIPVVLLALPAGQAADRFERRYVVMAALATIIVSSLGLAALSYTRGPIPLFYVCLLVAGCAQAFHGAARSALLPRTVPDEVLEQAVTIGTSSSQAAYLVGPAIAGFLIAQLNAAAPIYALNAAFACVFLAALAGMRPMPVDHTGRASGWAEVFAGLRFVWTTEIMLAAITMDMIAVLLGGATTLLPIFAKDILGVGPQGLGWLLMAPSSGAFLTGLVMARRPPIRHNGAVLLWSVVGFGLATIGFGMSRVFWLSWAMLFLVGATDMVSMVIRQHLVQRFTPDAMRGRVAAVHAVFIGTSNELGGFESGLTAHLFGAVNSVVYGGLGTLITVGLTALKWPALRRLGEIAPGSEVE